MMTMFGDLMSNIGLSSSATSGAHPQTHAHNSHARTQTHTPARRSFTARACQDREAAEGVVLHTPSPRPLLAPPALPLGIGRAYLSDLSVARGGLSAEQRAAAQLQQAEDEAAEDETFCIPPNITADNLDEFSLYDVLGIGHNTSAGADTIKKAYRKAVLLYHPDKQVGLTGNKDDEEAIFLKIQLAVATLSDLGRRRAYDSQFDFDEAVPGKEETKVASANGAAAFCELYRPVFELNARFAEAKPVPNFGDENTPMSEVHAFYSYWVKFDSWRDFSATNMEHNPADAGDRYEKRWMQKENAGAAKKLKKKEVGRINDLVMAALENDPRIIADKLAQKKAKEDKVKARHEEANREAEQAAAAAARGAEQEAAAEEVLRQAREEKEKIRKWHARIRGAFRKSLRTIAIEAGTNATCEYGDLDFIQVEAVCTGSEPDTLLVLIEGLGADMKHLRLGPKGTAEAQEAAVQPLSLAAGMQRVRDAIAAHVAAEAAAAGEEETAREAAREIQREKAAEMERKKKGLDREWSRDDLSMLSRSLSRFPSGLGSRWETICTYLNAQIRPEVPFERSEVMRAAQNAMQFIAHKNAPSDGATTTTAAAAAAAAAAGPVSAGDASATAATVGSQLPPVPASASAPGAAAAAAVKDWTQTEQKLLEDGLRQHPAGKTPAAKAERWALIAASIPGRDAGACSDRYQFLRDQVKQGGVKQTPPPAPAAAAVAQVPVTVVEWTQTEQKLLEDGLRQHPAGKTPAAKAERWKLIAAKIPGRNANACNARYDYLRQQVKHAKK
jgi:DnaJ family protein C protein 2